MMPDIKKLSFSLTIGPPTECLSTVYTVLSVVLSHGIPSYTSHLVWLTREIQLTSRDSIARETPSARLSTRLQRSGVLMISSSQG